MLAPASQQRPIEPERPTSPAAARGPRSSLVTRLAYPAVMSLGLGATLLAGRAGIPPLLGAYAAVAGGAALILLAEWRVPHRTAWRAGRAETATDLAYLATVQTLLPLGLALTLVPAAARWLGPRAAAQLGALWPHRLPVLGQVGLMLLAADFARYWLHVACHRVGWLWRLHAVHHAPRTLHALNVGRFHPLEKTAQWACDAFAFALMGVGADVLALYFAFYALNGFFQHANVEVRLGPLNWVVSGPELHRWHHSRGVAESRVNYGNNLILWDVLFGTRRLPPAREVAALGLENARYPTRLGEQMRAPFVRGLEHADGPLLGWRDLALGWLLRARMAVVGAREWRRLEAAARDPEGAQRALLREILQRNRYTRFGLRHDFAAIAGPDDFRRRVPVADYEALRPWIEAHETTGAPVLTAEPPVAYARTSGTTGRPKDVPVPRAAFAAQRRGQRLFTYLQQRALPEAFAGRILAVVGAPIEGRLPSGTPFGSASGALYADMPRLARAKYVVPPEVFTVADPALRQRLILRLAVGERNVTAMGSANPSTFLRLQRLLGETRAALAADVERQGFSEFDALPARVRAVVRRRLRVPAARRAELRALLGRADLRLADLWPHLRLLVTWTGGSCGIALESVRTLLPPATQVAELGYLASELRGTLPLEPGCPGGLPTLGDNYFELVERTSWERGRPVFVGLAEAEPGREYHVVVTTRGGLYRYFMNDVVRVVGRFHATPLLAFVQKGAGVTNVTGEKVSEGQVIEAARAAAAAAGLVPRFFLALADEHAARYRLLLEPHPSAVRRVDVDVLGRAFDARLAGLNLEYRGKRASGRLGAPTVHLLPDGWADAYRAAAVAAGQREEQWKPRVLLYARELELPWPDAPPLAAGPVAVEGAS